MLSINTERFLFKHCFQVPEERLCTKLTGIGFDPVRSCFSHAVYLSTKSIQLIICHVRKINLTFQSTITLSSPALINSCEFFAYPNADTLFWWPCSSYVVPLLPPRSHTITELSALPLNSNCGPSDQNKERTLAVCPLRTVTRLAPDCWSFSIVIWPAKSPMKTCLESESNFIAVHQASNV